MNDPLGKLFEQFLKERVYLKAITPKTKVWHQTAWKALQAWQAVPDDGDITKAVFVLTTCCLGSSASRSAGSTASGTRWRLST